MSPAAQGQGPGRARSLSPWRRPGIVSDPPVRRSCGNVAWRKEGAARSAGPVVRRRSEWHRLRVLHWRLQWGAWCVV